MDSDQLNPGNGENRTVGTKPVDREAVKRLPVIDISAFVENGPETARAETAMALREACINTGFFYISGHGISVGELDRCVELSHRFFELPADIKMAYCAKSMAEPGYIRVGGVNPENADAKTTDLKERFSMDRGAGPAAGSAAGGAHWPSETVLPRFSQFLLSHLNKRYELTGALCRAFACSLFLPENFFDRYFENTAHASLLNYYPLLDEAALANNQWSFAPHTDYGAFTILSQDATGGLQVRNFAGEWIEVPPIEGTFVINIGDLMSRWTNDLYTSNLHRARNVSGVARVSIPFFVTPHPDAIIECLETCTNTDQPPRYPAVRCGDYIRQLVARSNATGKPGISERTSERLDT